MTALRCLPLALGLTVAGCGGLLGGRAPSSVPPVISARPQITDRPGTRRAGSDISLPANRTAPWWSALLYCPSGSEGTAVSPNAYDSCLHADSVGANLGDPPNPVIGRVP
jgi:hypothetical protein